MAVLYSSRAERHQRSTPPAMLHPINSVPEHLPASIQLAAWQKILIFCCFASAAAAGTAIYLDNPQSGGHPLSDSLGKLLAGNHYFWDAMASHPTPTTQITEAPIVNVIQVLATPTSTETRQPTLTATPTRTKEPATVTATTAPTKKPTAVRTNTPVPSPTHAPIAPEQPKASALDGRSPDNAPKLETGMTYMVLPGEKRFVIIGDVGQKIMINSFIWAGDLTRVTFKFMDWRGPEDQKAVREWLAGKADRPTVRAQIIQDKGWVPYDGKTGSAIFIGVIENNGTTPFTFSAKVNNKPAECAQEGNPGGAGTGSYFEYVSRILTNWKTCDRNWLGNNGQ